MTNSANTFWVLDTNDQPFANWGCGRHEGDGQNNNNGNWDGNRNGCFNFPLINASDTNFSQPYVLTYPQSGYPTDKPRPSLQVDNLSGYTTGVPADPNFPSIHDNQMWGADFGPF